MTQDTYPNSSRILKETDKSTKKQSFYLLGLLIKEEKKDFFFFFFLNLRGVRR